MPVQVKTIGSSGQISLGKENAGRTVTVEETEKGVWVIKAGQFVPDSELWLHTPEAKAKLDRGIAWAQANAPKASNLGELEKRFRKRR